MFNSKETTTMKAYLFAAIAALALASTATATPGNNGGGNGGCGQGQQTNGCGGSATVDIDNSPTIEFKPTNTVAPITNVSPDIEVKPSITTTVSPDIRNTSTVAPVIATNVSPDIRNDNRDTNINGQDQRQGQGQLQGQGQGQQQQATSSSSSGASSDQTQDQSQSTSISLQAIGSGNKTEVGGQQAEQTNDQKVTVEGDVYEAQRRSPVSSAYAAPLAIGGGVCAYTPASASGQFVSFGLSGSAAKIDEGCERRATADVFARIGMTYEACQIMASAKYAVAAGIVCTRPLPLSDEPAALAPVVVPATPAPLPALPPSPEAAGERGF